MAVLDLRPNVATTTEVNVIPQLVARASLLELSQDDLEERIKEKLRKNPSLRLKQPLGAPHSTKSPPHNQDPTDPFDAVAAPHSLTDDLLWQLRMTCEDDLLDIATYVIESLDDRGYLTTNAIALSEELGVPEPKVQQAVDLVQQLDPPGVAARDLTECLKLQAQRLRTDSAPPGLLEFIDGKLDQLIQNGDPDTLRRVKTSGAQVYLKFIATQMYPYPADTYRTPQNVAAGQPPAKTPDAVVERCNGELQVSVPLSNRLGLIVDSAYQRLARKLDSTDATDDEKHVRKLVADAREFISNVTHRHHIIGRVTEIILRKQEEFLEKGPSALKPMTKKHLAQKLNVHESTICRATRGKSMMLPDGEVVPFDTFFEEALPAKVTLARIIHNEDPEHPLTDGQLADELTQYGFDLARRTISKYRSTLDIPPAYDRKKRRRAS